MTNFDSLFNSYLKLNDNEKSIVDAIVLIFEPISIYELQTFFISKGIIKNMNHFNTAFTNVKKYRFIPDFDGYHIEMPFPLALRFFPYISKKDENRNLIKFIDERFSGVANLTFTSQNICARCVRNLLFDYFLEKNDALKMSVTNLGKANFNVLCPILINMIYIQEYHNLLLSLDSELFANVLFNDSRETTLWLNDSSIIELLINNFNNQVNKKSDNRLLDYLQAKIILFQGNIHSPLLLNNKFENGLLAFIKSLALMYQGVDTEASDLYLKGLQENRKIRGNTKFLPENYFTFFYLIHLLIDLPKNHVSELNKLKAILVKLKIYDQFVILPLVYLCGSQKYEATSALKLMSQHQIAELLPFNKIIFIISSFLINGRIDDELKETTSTLLKDAIESRNLLIALELAFVISASDNFSEKDKLKLNTLKNQLKIQPILSRIKNKAEWEHSLESLLSIGSGKNKKTDKLELTNRLVFFVDLDQKFVQPMLQTLSSKGWSRGRNIALKRLKERQVDGMTEQDNRIAATVRHEKSYYGSEYYIDFHKMLPELAGHPYLFYFDNPDISIELVKTQPELFIEKTTKGYILKTDISSTEQKIILKKETNTRFNLIQLSDEQLSIIRALDNGRLLIPETGKEQLMKSMSHVSSFMTVHSDLNGVDKNIKQIDADSRIRVQLLPIGDTLKVEWFVKPFGAVPPYSKPGKGGKTLYGTLNNEKCLVVRKLDLENQNAVTLSNKLLTITDFDLAEGPAVFDNPEDCLALLESLQQNNDIAMVEWPEGERFKVRRSVTFNQLNLSVKGKGHWFEMSGELKVDEDTVISLKQLLDITAKSKNRFVELSNGEFLALTDEFKKRLNELALYSTIDKSGIKLNKFAAPALGELSEMAGSFKTDKAWKDFQKNIEKNRDLNHQIPSNLQAELRPYQEEGFYWMARLADWDAGACLADDMGLGKTLQALAILLHRAEKGPALVIAPASVVANWVAEASKFAPSLNVRLLRNNNREEILEKLASFDILIITYGILQSEEAQLTKIDWATVVLDEAHIIKNNNTKTSKAAMNIQARFRLLLTGTPIQNHLGELWNLFNFINPGLLGTLQQFNERFVTPALKYGGSTEKAHLKKLISPFILRRTKSNVLDELPPKTEITQLIELSADEMAFYEALRRNAIETIESSEGPTGQQHLKALAEITKLRLACCNPSLVNKNIELPSSKLNAFSDIVDDLLENNHRALVFSQFIGHLAIVRNMLDERKISYQYLDGSTSLEKRSIIVKEFQEGKGDLFLISLKAGGLGLNLTTADYVIHMDPWWNPAIEDQASDRAHRIGQIRPVTVYRLVAQNTIEEKIIQLHNTKRDMADSLLEGSDQSAKLNTNDLLNLLKEI